VHVLYKPDKALGHDGQKEKQGAESTADSAAAATAVPVMNEDPQSH
jgi:hypothetical protein